MDEPEPYDDEKAEALVRGVVIAIARMMAREDHDREEAERLAESNPLRTQTSRPY